jgi:hypothetical protein
MVYCFYTYPILGEADDDVQVPEDEDVHYGGLMTEQGHEGLLGDHGVPQSDHAVITARSKEAHRSLQVETADTLNKHQSAVRVCTKNRFRSDFFESYVKVGYDGNHILFV